MNDNMIKMISFFAASSFMGWILFFIGLSVRREIRRRIDNERTQTSGIIVDYVKKTRQARRTASEPVYYVPVIEFRVLEQLVRFEYTDSIDQKQHPVGSSVTLFYDSYDPSHFHLEQDARFADSGKTAIRIASGWILFCAVLTIVLGVFVGGATLDFRHMRRSFQRLISGQKQTETVTSTIVSDDYEFRELSSTSAQITRYKGTSPDVTLPVFFNGHAIVSFSHAAFSGSRFLGEVVIPGTFSAVPMGAFAGCHNLYKVTLREGVKSIGNSAFTICPVLKEVTLPASLKSIAADAFPEDCKATFYVTEGTDAYQYCLEHGFTIVTTSK